MSKFFYTLLFLLIPFFSICAQILTGKVVAISDGDTFTLLTQDKKQVKIRLHGVDCPESKQDFGTKAKQFTSALCFGKMVKAEIKTTDRYGRKIALVSLLDGRSLNKGLLKAGLAWHYKYYDKSEEFALLEQQARLKRIGLWSSKSRVAPWDFRKSKRNNFKKASAPGNNSGKNAYCGATTSAGKSCKHITKNGTKCWQHKAAI